uniref:Uncharacterized protein n=1 Tax=Oryza rufipogon TaxID=4529 RepID=A0A0E0RC86_ORYRU
MSHAGARRRRPHPPLFTPQWSSPPAASSSTVTSHVRARRRRPRPPSSTNHVGAHRRWPRPPPTPALVASGRVLRRQCPTPELVAGGHILRCHIPCRNSSPAALHIFSGDVLPDGAARRGSGGLLQRAPFSPFFLRCHMPDASARALGNEKEDDTIAGARDGIPKGEKGRSVRGRDGGCPIAHSDHPPISPPQ